MELGVQKVYWVITPVKEKGKKKDGAGGGIAPCSSPDKVCKPNRMLWSKDFLLGASQLGPFTKAFLKSLMEEHRNMTSA